MTKCTTHRDPFERGHSPFPNVVEAEKVAPTQSQQSQTRHPQPAPYVQSQNQRSWLLGESFQSVANPSSLLVSQEEEPSLLSILLEKTCHTALKVKSERLFLKSFPCAP